MSNSIEKLPAGYTPYRELRVCSNEFVNTKIAVEVEEHAPMLIGAGDGPRVWLSAPTGQGKPRWTLVVADNESRVADVVVRRTPQGGLEVMASDTKVLEVQQADTESAAVTWLDLRPLGLEIHGDSDALWIGTNQFSANKFTNCDTAIGISGRQAP